MGAMSDLTLKECTLAVASGKGGVGKTTTSVNLALYAARRGLRTALVDLDPLSDIATLLDLPEEFLARTGMGVPSDRPLADWSVSVLDRLDLVFPGAKYNREERSGLKEILSRVYSQTPSASGAYDVVILDLPAGVDEEENLTFLELAGRVVLVTNSEPTAHVAGGMYLKEAWKLREDLPFGLWHNKYTPATEDGFDPSDLVGNYNRNVPEEDRISPDSAAALEELARIPSDPALDLLQNIPSVTLYIQLKMADKIQTLAEQRIYALSRKLSLPARMTAALRYYVKTHPQVKDPQIYLAAWVDYVLRLLPQTQGEALQDGSLREKPLLREGQKKEILAFLRLVRDDAFLKALSRPLSYLQEAIDSQQGRNRLFASEKSLDYNRVVDREVCSLLQFAARRASDPLLKNMAGLLLFDFALFKLLQSQTVVNTITHFIPRREEKGKKVRDKRGQIFNLVQKSERYQIEFLQLVKKLYPLAERQMGEVVKTFSLNSLLFRDSQGKVLRPAYVKLLTTVIHDTVHSGLGVIIGFRHSPVSRAFAQGAEGLLPGKEDSSGGPRKAPETIKSEAT